MSLRRGYLGQMKSAGSGQKAGQPCPGDQVGGDVMRPASRGGDHVGDLNHGAAGAVGRFAARFAVFEHEAAPRGDAQHLGGQKIGVGGEMVP